MITHVSVDNDLQAHDWPFRKFWVLLPCPLTATPPAHVLFLSLYMRETLVHTKEMCRNLVKLRKEATPLRLKLHLRDAERLVRPLTVTTCSVSLAASAADVFVECTVCLYVWEEEKLKASAQFIWNVWGDTMPLWEVLGIQNCLRMHVSLSNFTLGLNFKPSQ